MSEHKVQIIKIENVLPHENAERLEIIPIGGWQAVVKKDSFKVGDKAVYIEPDYMVPTNLEEFSFLAKEGKDFHRLKAIRLRGVLSYGLLLPVPERYSDYNIGDNLIEQFGIARYEPVVKFAKSDELEEVNWPKVYSSKFDIESLQRYPEVLTEGEPVIVTEKIHGANARYVFSNGEFFLGSRTRWLKPDVQTPWKQAVDLNPNIIAWCENNPEIVLYGEIYGPVQSLKYGCSNGQVKFAAFATLKNGEWLNTSLLHDDATIETVPVVYEGPWHSELILQLAEDDSAVAGVPTGHMREGLVIVPTNERRDLQVGRVALKHISNRYWEFKD